LLLQAPAQFSRVFWFLSHTCPLVQTKEYSESKCKSVIAFIDMLNIALAIYAGETRYNIVKMNPYESPNLLDNNPSLDTHISTLDIREYRIFSQAR